MNIKTITRKKADKLNMQIWHGDNGEQFARLQHGQDRENPLYGYVFLIINNNNMNIIKELKENNIEKCPQCNCPVGDDWEYKDFTNKSIVICPQCKENLFLKQ